MYRLLLLLSFCMPVLGVSGQSIYYTMQNAHSHNDYEQRVPYWMAYNQGFGSIEADIFLHDSDLIVAHDEKELKFNRSFGKLYLDNIDSCLKKNAGYPYKDTSRKLQLLIDIKTDSIETLRKLISLLEQYSAIIHNRHVFLVITGNRPDPDSFSGYPDYIWFDGVLSKSYSQEQLSRVKMLSDNFRQYSLWHGEGQMPTEDFEKLKIKIAEAHRRGIPARLWNAPDLSNAWMQLTQLQVDYINTDHIEELAQWLEKGHFELYKN